MASLSEVPNYLEVELLKILLRAQVHGINVGRLRWFDFSSLLDKFIDRKFIIVEVLPFVG